MSVNIDGLGVSSPLQFPLDTFHASLMLTVFNMGRDCYWDDSQTLVTSTVPFNDPATSPIKTGKVSHWEIRIPSTGEAQLYLHLLQATAQRTSGDAATGWAMIQAPVRDIAVALALASSRYCFLSSIGLRNTDFFDVLPGWPKAEP